MRFQTSSTACYTNALRCRRHSPGNINRAKPLERGGIGITIDTGIPFDEEAPVVKVNPQREPMSQARSPASPSKPLRGSFRQRYDDLETKRAELVTRLTTLGDAAHRHPGYKRAFKLLNDTFRKSKLTQRLAVLQAAAWLIDILEKVTAAF